MILSYHRVNPWYDRDAITVSPTKFSKQIFYLLSKNFQFLTTERYVQEFFTQKSNKKVVISFDDGYVDNLWFAFQILKDLKISPIIYLTVSYIGTNILFPRYKDTSKDRFLNWQEVLQMAKDGVEFGSHTLTHSYLTKIDRKQAEREIIESKKIIEDKIGKEIKFFCYPYGDFNSEIIEIVKKTGYKGAVVVRKKGMKITKFTLPRVGIYAHNNNLIYRAKIWREYIKEIFY